MQKVVDTVPLFPSLGWGKQSFSLILCAPFKAMGASVQNFSLMPLLQSLSSLLISIMQNAQLPMPV